MEKVAPDTQDQMPIPPVLTKPEAVEMLNQSADNPQDENQQYKKIRVYQFRLGANASECKRKIEPDVQEQQQQEEESDTEFKQHIYRYSPPKKRKRVEKPYKVFVGDFMAPAKEEEVPLTRSLLKPDNPLFAKFEVSSRGVSTVKENLHEYPFRVLHNSADPRAHEKVAPHYHNPNLGLPLPPSIYSHNTQAPGYRPNTVNHPQPPSLRPSSRTPSPPHHSPSYPYIRTSSPPHASYLPTRVPSPPHHSLSPPLSPSRKSHVGSIAPRSPEDTKYSEPHSLNSQNSYNSKTQMLEPEEGYTPNRHLPPLVGINTTPLLASKLPSLASLFPSVYCNNTK
eukprot:TRINITY_DN10296_c0_g1_i1.p1 TRINITY_DN10296_c0_g1~~TRINITY_DN10296_c0_g1_i1.p1  ORF type:complete len:345 (+),score=52.03 TRINITY_DN10296_c0_g1_i1:23-1036(+)